MNNLTDEDFEGRLRAVLQADATRAPAGSPVSPIDMSQRRRRFAPGLPEQRRVRLAVAAGLVVVMAAGLSAGLSLAGGSQAPLSAPANAAELLVRAAASSAAQPVPRDDQYIYTEATGISPASLQPGSSRTIRYTTWTWSSVDGKTGNLVHQKPCQRVLGGPGRLGPLTCSERWQGMGTAVRLPNGTIGAMGGTLPVKLPKGTERVRSLPQTYAAARELPTSARPLATYLRDLPRNGGPVPIWQQLADLVEFVPVLPPKVAAAVFTLASQQPRIALRHVTDAAGQPGIGVSQAGDPLHVQLIFNPATYRLEGIDVTNSNSIIAPTGPVTGARSFAILHTAIVNSEPSS